MAYSIDVVDKQIRVNPGSSLLNLNFADVDTLLNNPLATAGENKVIHAVGILHNTDLPDLSFYIENVSDRVGWNVADCVEISEPRYTPPTGALPVPLATTDYTLVVSVMGYGTKSEAAEDRNALTTLPEGDYLLFQIADNGMMHVGQTRGGIKYWINPADNVEPVPEPEPEPEVVPSNWVNPRELSVKPEPEPEPTPEPVAEPESDKDWKKNYDPFYPPREYVANIDGRIWNLDEYGREINVVLRKGKHYMVYGTVPRDGQIWYRLKIESDTKMELWPCVPMMYNGRAVLILSGPSFMDHILHGWEKTKRASLDLRKSIFKDEPSKFIDGVKNPYTQKEGK